MTRVHHLDLEDVVEPAAELSRSLDSTGNFINLYRAMAHSPKSLQRFIDLASCLWGGGLSPRTIEVAILSTVSALGAEYPLAWHIGDGRGAGLTNDEMRAIIGGDTSGILTEADAAVADFARRLTIDAAVSDDLFANVRSTMDERRIVELTLLVGLYNLVGRVANGLEVELDPAAAGLLSEFG